MKKLIVVIILCLLAFQSIIKNASAQNNFVPVSISPIANGSLSNLYINSPSGNVTLGGIPFTIPPVPNMAASEGGRISSMKLPIDDFTNVTKAYFLINSYDTWLTFAGQKLGEIVFDFADNSNYKIDLIIGGNIREWRQGNDVSPTINSVNDSNSQEVFRGLPNTFLGGPAVIDMLSVNLPQNFQGKTLKKITLTDIIILPHPTTGPGSAPGFIWMGLTVQGSVVSPTPTPTPTPVPIPFLDLPWDYQGKTFENAGLDPVSWFDHEYPLQNVSCCEEQVKNYTGNTISKPYRSHNGYDYGLKNGVELNTPVLAAASGTATFSDDCGACGNMILIDHGNGYQTRYLHLQKDGLIVSEEGEDHKVSVEKGQQIGKTGMTGKATGPHIHFSVFQDTDGDESFDDENPYGVTDPLGWEGSLPDPWSEYKFEGNPDDETDDKTGTASFNLFIKRAAPQTVAVDQNGGTFTFGNLEVTVPADTVVALSKLSNNWGPFESIKDSIKSIIPSFFLELKDSSGQKITQFSKPVQISYDYSSADLKNIDEDSLQLYSFNDQTNQWDPIATILDKINKIARGETLHFSQFALMGEVKDLIAPTTQVLISGEKGQDNWYRSDVTVELNGQDNDGGIGLQYTLYTINGNDWFEYTSPLVFKDERTFQITYQSFDKAENKEERQTLIFHIDKTAPEAKIYIDQDKQDLIIEGLDQNQTTVDREDAFAKKQDDAIYTITDLAGNSLVLEVRDRDKAKQDTFKIYSLKYNQDLPIELPDNHYNVKYKGKKNKLNVDEQNFVIWGEVKIRIRYDRKKDQSTIMTKESGKERIKEVKNGLILLQLTTNQGNLEYSY